MISEENVLYNQDKLKIIRRILEIIRISNPNRIIRVSDDATFTEKNLNINEESSEN
jgi:spore coat polysaccharide biosynthesis protein SpsF (cytidylyltransferase family)